MDFILDLEDSFVSQYLVSIYENAEITDQDFSETLSDYFSCENIDTILHHRSLMLKEYKNAFESENQKIYIPQQRFEEECVQSKQKTKDVDKKRIIKMYSDIEVKNTPCNPFVSYLEKKDNKKDVKKSCAKKSRSKQSKSTLQNTSK
jgi:tyrosyl-tRNA synthetase